MSIAGLVAAGRGAHERLMVDTCTITRETQGELDPSTGVYAPVVVTIYSGKCRVKVAPVTQAEAAERRNVISSPLVMLPLRDSLLLGGYDEGLAYDSNGYNVSEDVQERDTVTVVASVNIDLVGVEFSVIGAEESTTATARKFKIERRA